MRVTAPKYGTRRGCMAREERLPFPRHRFFASREVASVLCFSGLLDESGLCSLVSGQHGDGMNQMWQVVQPELRKWTFPGVADCFLLSPRSFQRSEEVHNVSDIRVRAEVRPSCLPSQATPALSKLSEHRAAARLTSCFSEWPFFALSSHSQIPNHSSNN